LFLLARKYSNKTIFDGTVIIFAGSFLNIFYMLGDPPFLVTIGIMATLFLTLKEGSYRLNEIY